MFHICLMTNYFIEKSSCLSVSKARSLKNEIRNQKLFVNIVAVKAVMEKLITSLKGVFGTPDNVRRLKILAFKYYGHLKKINSWDFIPRSGRMIFKIWWDFTCPNQISILYNHLISLVWYWMVFNIRKLRIQTDRKLKRTG